MTDNSEQPGFWSKVPSRVFEDTEIWKYRSTPRILLAIYAHRRTKTGISSPTQGRLAELTGVSLRTVSRAVRRLEDLGYITASRQGGPGNRCTYTFPNDPCLTVPDTPPRVSHPESSGHAILVAQPNQSGHATQRHPDTPSTGAPTKERTRRKMKEQMNKNNNKAPHLDREPPPQRTPSDVVVAFQSGDWETDRTGADGEARKIIADAGVTCGPAAGLLADTPVARLRAVAAYAAANGKGPGWFIMAARGNWALNGQATETGPDPGEAALKVTQARAALEAEYAAEVKASREAGWVPMKYVRGATLAKDTREQTP